MDPKDKTFTFGLDFCIFYPFKLVRFLTIKRINWSLKKPLKNLQPMVSKCFLLYGLAACYLERQIKMGQLPEQLTAKLALQGSALPLENFNQKLKMVENHWNLELVNSCRGQTPYVKVVHQFQSTAISWWKVMNYVSCCVNKCPTVNLRSLHTSLTFKEP